MSGTTKPVRFVSKYTGLALTIETGKDETTRIKFAYGEFITSDPKIANGIRNHPSFKRDFDEVKEDDLKKE